MDKVRTQLQEEWYLTVVSALPESKASKTPTYPAHLESAPNSSLQ